MLRVKLHENHIIVHRLGLGLSSCPLPWSSLALGSGANDSRGRYLWSYKTVQSYRLLASGGNYRLVIRYYHFLLCWCIARCHSVLILSCVTKMCLGSVHWLATQARRRPLFHRTRCSSDPSKYLTRRQRLQHKTCCRRCDVESRLASAGTFMSQMIRLDLFRPEFPASGLMSPKPCATVSNFLPRMSTVATLASLGFWPQMMVQYFRPLEREVAFGPHREPRPSFTRIHHYCFERRTTS